MATHDDLTLAALLHDIGKFYQRTGNKRVDQDLAKMVCPERNGRPTHLHAAWTADFLGDRIEKSWASSKHHNPKSDEDILIALADRLASGERQTSDEIPQSQASTTPLHAPFSYLKNARNREPLKLPLVSLKDTDNFLPDSNPIIDYADLWDQFASHADDLQSEQRKSVDVWLTLLRHYTTRIPSATPWERDAQKTIPDISLYDHLHLTAAIAQALAHRPGVEAISTLFRQHQEGKTGDKTIFHLLAGDLSGIQSFLYHIRGQRAVRSLKGRSFFLQLLIHAATRFVLKKLDLNAAAILYESGGKFFAVIPAETSDDTLAGIRQELNEILIRHFQGDLHISLAQTEVLGRHMADASEVWKSVMSKLSLLKKRRFAAEIEDDPKSILGPFEALTSICPVCHAHPASEGEEPCSYCLSFESLGRDLVSSRYLLLSDNGASEDISGWQRVLCDLLGSKPQFTGSLSGYNPDFIYFINDLNIKALGRDKPFATLLLANHTPVENGHLRDFQTIARGGADAPGDDKLMFLRADVDNLGTTFKNGFQEHSTFGRATSLSRHIDELFTVGIERACTKVDPDHKYLYIIYAGGDDLFLLGRWNVVIQFLQQFHKDFIAYTGGNLSFSAGTITSGPKSPLLLNASLAGEEEEKAKMFRKEKGVINIFGLSVPFESLTDWLENAMSIEKSVIDNKAHLQRLRRTWVLYSQEKDLLEKENLSVTQVEKLVRYSRWRWMLRYLFRESRSSDIESLLSWIEKDNEPENIKALPFIVSYLHLKTRKEVNP